MEYFADHMRSCVKAPQKRRLIITGDSHEAAVFMGQTVKSAFGGEWCDTGTALDKDAIVKFEFVWQRNDAVKYVNRDVDNYRNGHQDTVLENLLASSENHEDENAASDEDEDEEGKKTGWTTYAIIGLAALAVILLVWPKRKKR